MTNSWYFKTLTLIQKNMKTSNCCCLKNVPTYLLTLFLTLNLPLLTLVVSIIEPLNSNAQGVGINEDGSLAADGAILDIKSTSSGLLIPRMTEAQRDAIVTKPHSLLIYQTDGDSGFYYYHQPDAAWHPFLSGGARANSGWATEGNAGTNPNANFIGTIDSVDWVVKTNNNEKMRVTGNGNVGIGASPGSQKLYLYDDVDGKLDFRVENPNAGTSANARVQIRNNTGGGMEIGVAGSNYSSKPARQNRAILLSGSKLDGISLISYDDIKFFTDGDETAGAERMLIDTNGHVGIGTGSVTAGDAILDISSSNSGLLIPRMTETERDLIATPSTSLLIYQTNNDSGFYFYDGTGWTPFLTSGAGDNSGWTTRGNAGTTVGTHFLGTTDAEDFAIYTNNTERIRFDQTGNVGIGASPGSQKLFLYDDVNGKLDLRIQNPNAGTSAKARVQIRNNTGGGMEIGVDGSNNSAKPARQNRGYLLTGSALDGVSVISADDIKFYTNQDEAVGAEKMLIATNGDVGIGTTTPTQKLDVNGNIAVTGVTVHTSDKRYKKNISPIDQALEKIIQVEGVSYYFKQRSFNNKALDNHLQFGIIAQELEEIFPHLVYTQENGYKAINYTGLTPVIIEAIKAQNETIKQQDKIIQQLITDNVSLQLEMEQIKAYLELNTKK